MRSSAFTGAVCTSILVPEISKSSLGLSRCSGSKGKTAFDQAFQGAVQHHRVNTEHTRNCASANSGCGKESLQTGSPRWSGDAGRWPQAQPPFNTVPQMRWALNSWPRSDGMDGPADLQADSNLPSLDSLRVRRLHMHSIARYDQRMCEIACALF